MLTQKQRDTNLTRIAKAAVALERVLGVPAELTTVQCILESRWLEKAPGNNSFGIKGEGQVLTTEEDLTPQQIKALKVKYEDLGPALNGRRTIRIRDSFRVFPTLEAAFQEYGLLLVEGKNFKARFERYRTHRDLQQLLKDMSGADGKPVYFTGQLYIPTFNAINAQSNVRAAIAAARAAA